MNAKRATLRLFVAATGLIASILELGAGIVRLITATLNRLASFVRPQKAPVAPSLALAPTVLAKAPQTARMTEDERLTSALLSLKFPAGKVRAFTASVQGRQAPLEMLVKEGIVALTAN